MAPYKIIKQGYMLKEPPPSKRGLRKVQQWSAPYEFCYTKCFVLCIVCMYVVFATGFRNYVMEIVDESCFP